MSGLYYLPLPLAEHETGYEESKLKSHFDELDQKGLAKYDSQFELIWVVNMLKYQAHNEKQLKAVAKHLDSLHECVIIKQFIDYYDTLSIPYQYPTDRVSGVKNNSGYPSVSVSVTDTVPGTELDTSQCGEHLKGSNGIPKKFQASVSRVIGYIRQKQNLPFPRDGTKKLKRCERAIVDRLRDGYTEDDLILHVDKLSGKVSAHRWFEKRHGKPPPINDRCWCPNDEYFGPERFEKYFTKWQDEPVLTVDLLEKEFLEAAYS